MFIISYHKINNNNIIAITTSIKCCLRTSIYYMRDDNYQQHLISNQTLHRLLKTKSFLRCAWLTCCGSFLERERWKSVPFQWQTVPSSQLFPGTLLHRGAIPPPPPPPHPRCFMMTPFATHADPCSCTLSPLLWVHCPRGCNAQGTHYLLFVVNWEVIKPCLPAQGN